MFTPVEYTKWSDRLCFDIALRLEGSGEDLPEILSRHRITPLELSEFSKDPIFDKKVRHYREEIRDKGITFRLKARAQAEELLTTSWTLIHNPDVSAAVKADLIKSTIKWAGLETKGDVTEGGTGGVSITINLGGEQQTMRLVPHEETIEEIDGYADESVDDRGCAVFTSANAAAAVENNLRDQGVSFKTSIVKTRKRGLEYRIQLLDGLGD